jgi:hypothetical protein
MHDVFIVRYLKFGLRAAMVINFLSIAWAAQPVREGPELFVKEEPVPIEQAPTTPIKLINEKDDYICSFNALTQVLWRLAPLNDRLREAMRTGKIEHDNNIVRKYLASIQARETWQAPLYLNPFIDEMNKVARRNLSDSSEVLLYFNQKLPPDIQSIFSITYEETVFCPAEQEKKAGTHEKPTNSELRWFNVDIDVAQESAKEIDLQKELNFYDGTPQQIDSICTCGSKKKRGRLITRTPIILVIKTERIIPNKDKNSLPCNFPFINLKFGDKTYDLMGVIFHGGLGAGAGHYYSWVEQNGEWHICNDTEIKSFSNKYFEDATHVDSYLIMPHKFTNLLIYMQKPIMQKLRLIESPFLKTHVPKIQKNAARAAWPPSAANANSADIIQNQLKGFDAAASKQLTAINQKLAKSYKRAE